MKIIGERVLLKRVEPEKAEGFETVQVANDFVSRGRIAQVGQPVTRGYVQGMATGALGRTAPVKDDFAVGNVVLFAKFSPDTQEVTVDGEAMKVVLFTDIIAIEEYA